MDDEIETLKNYIRTEIGYSGPINPDDDLLATRVLDSFNIVGLALYAQECFNVEFDAEDLVRDNLAKLSSLVALVKTRRAEAS